MGYFNYFIKCIIRNIAYKLCKPKVFLTVLLSAAILFVLHTTGYCADETSETTTVVPSEGTDTGAFQYDNNYLTLREMQEQVQLDFITKMYANYSIDPVSTKNFVSILLLELNLSGSSYKGLYVEKGVNYSQYKIYSYDYNYLSFSHTGSYTISDTSFVNITYMKGTFYERTVNSDNTLNSTATKHNDKSVPYPFLKVLVPEWKQMFIDFGLIQTDFQSDVLEKLDALIANSQQSDNEIANKIEEGNQLQEESNQLQQEQNDFLKDDNVNTDNLQFATDNTNNPTSEGFNTLFTSIYNAFCNTSSAPLTITLPFINQSFSISPNLVSNAMGKSGLGLIATLIHSFYYYSVCLFIYKDINKIIEHLKSGNLTADCGNVKTEVL